jgi:hypothetical protein
LHIRNLLKLHIAIQWINQSPSDFLLSPILVLHAVEDGALGWFPVMEEGIADDCDASVHASEAREGQKAV